MPIPATSQRWSELLQGIVSVLPAGTGSVLVDGGTGAPAARDAFAARLRLALSEGGFPVRLACGARESDARAWDIVIWSRPGPFLTQ